jgi:hypothetical protein
VAFPLSVMDAAMAFSEYPLFHCCVCGDPVDLRTAKTDEYGKANHEDCYVLRMRMNAVCSGPLRIRRVQRTRLPIVKLAGPKVNIIVISHPV